MHADKVSSEFLSTRSNGGGTGFIVLLFARARDFTKQKYNRQHHQQKQTRQQQQRQTLQKI